MAHGFIFRSFQPRLAATLLRSCSVVNSPIRPAGLPPAIQPASLAQRLTGFDRVGLIGGWKNENIESFSRFIPSNCFHSLDGFELSYPSTPGQGTRPTGRCVMPMQVWCPHRASPTIPQAKFFTLIHFDLAGLGWITPQKKQK
jgi:hypothetical protein